MITESQIAQALSPYGTPLSGELLRQIRVYVELLQRWNRRISLTSVRDELEIVRFHFGESLFLLNFFDLKACRLADVGSGAGFPGIPLKMARPEVEVLLVEPNRKKAAFLAEITRILDLDRIRVERYRYQDVDIAATHPDFITCRAVSGLKDLLNWAHQSLNSSGVLAFWIGPEGLGLSKELPDWKWAEAVRIPGSKQRFILTGSPVK